MRKKMFYGFALFVTLFMIAVWQVAAAELADIETQQEYKTEGDNSLFV